MLALAHEETQGYKKLIVWQKAMELVPRVYDLSRKLPREERYGLGDQMRRAAVSIPANIAEGQARCHAREFAQYLSIARGSAAELDTLLLLGVNVGYLQATEVAPLESAIIDVRRLLQGLIQSIRNRKPK